MKKKMKRLHGWLTHDEVELLEEASKRKLKYAKNYAQKYKCKDCEYSWFYTSLKCPLCSSTQTEKA